MYDPSQTRVRPSVAKLLNRLYYDPKQAPAFKGVSALYRAANAHTDKAMKIPLRVERTKDVHVAQTDTSSISPKYDRSGTHGRAMAG